MKAKSTHDLDAAIGSALRKERERLKLTQSSVARALGVTFQQVQKYESGKNRLSISALARISLVCGISAQKILDKASAFEGKKSKPPVTFLKVHTTQRGI